MLPAFQCSGSKFGFVDPEAGLQPHSGPQQPLEATGIDFKAMDFS